MNSFYRQVGSVLRACSVPLALATAFVAQPASAAILATMGDVTVAPKPLTVAEYPDGPEIYAFLEAEAIAFPAGVNLNAGTISEGRLVDSYLLHLDPNPNVSTTVTGSITFNQPVLGYVWQKKRLNNTDALFSAITPIGQHRGLETNDLDASVLAIREAEINLSFTAAGTGIDQVRVFVSAPEPASTAGLVVLGAAGVGAVIKRRLQAASLASK